MAVEIALKRDTPIVWADTTDYSTIHGLVRTHQIDMTSLADGAARQGEDADLTAIKAQHYTVKVCVEFGASAPTALEPITVYFGSSASATTGFPGGLGASDAAYTGRSSDLANSIRSLVGPFTAPVSALGAGTVQIFEMGVLHGAEVDRYVVPVLKNDGAQAFDTDATNMYIALIPHIYEDQSA